MTSTPLFTGLATDPKLLEHLKTMRTMVSKFVEKPVDKRTLFFNFITLDAAKLSQKQYHFEGADLQCTAEWHCQQPETCNSKSSSNPSSTTDSKATNTTAKKNSYYNFGFTDFGDFTTTSTHNNSDRFSQAAAWFTTHRRKWNLYRTVVITICQDFFSFPDITGVSDVNTPQVFIASPATPSTSQQPQPQQQPPQ